jgi:2,4-dienoyl-CoA reductase-like NADH-dependent reductase (Old Yellow Enzyme family)
MTERDIGEKVEDFSRAALMAKNVGFDAVEVHAGHGYLLSQFISPWTNKRTDSYGGSLENRMRFPKEVIQNIREQVGPGFPILVKMNQYDGMKGGLTLEEAVEAARMFEEAGASALIPSCGFTSKTPLQMLRGHVPVKEMVANQKDPLRKTGLLLFGKTMVQHYAYERLFLLPGAVKIKNAVSIPVVYIGGIKEKKDIVEVLESGLDFVQLGRTLIHDPEFVNKIETGKVEGPLCDHCNRCVAAMDGGGVNCVSRETNDYLY